MTLASGGSRPSIPVTGELNGMHEFKNHSSCQRGLFPLPFENDVKQLPSGLSRGCRQRVGRRRELSTRVSELARALNSLYGVEEFPTATRTSPAQDETDEFCIVLLRRSPLLSLVFHRRKPFGRFCVVPPFTAMAAALHPTLPSSSRCPIPACRSCAARGLRIPGGAQGEDPLEQ